VKGTVVALGAGVALVVGAGAARAQEAAPLRPVVRPAAESPRQLEQMRYQIGTMERVLENAVEHGASMWRNRLQAIAPVEASLVENARVRGYRLENYGLFFDVDVPSLETTLFAALQTLDQNGLNLANALKQVKSYIQSQAANDLDLQQAVRRLELQLPAAVTAASDQSTARRVAAPSGAADQTADVGDPILTNPAEAFRAEVIQAVIDAMLDHSGPLGIGPDEWLAVGLRRNEVRPRTGLEVNAQTYIARVRGSDLAAFRAGQLSREEAVKRVQVRVN